MKTEKILTEELKEVMTKEKKHFMIIRIYT
ncbi:hypothetical protein TFUB22_01704 [Tannerella forsythia]|nr:hypothetical protein TFUB22_01704 [Tannerella forsythia]